MTDCCPLGSVTMSRVQARRLKVIDTARILFTDNGFHATGMAQIARQSEIAVGQIYRDFASKEAIVAAIVERDCAAFIDDESLNRAIAANDPVGVRQWIRGIFVPDDEDDGRLLAEIIAESSRNERMANIFRTINDDVRVNVMAALEVLAPGEARLARRKNLTDMMMTISIGMLHYPLMRETRDTEIFCAEIRALIDREIDRLAD